MSFPGPLAATLVLAAALSCPAAGAPGVAAQPGPSPDAPAPPGPPASGPPARVVPGEDTEPEDAAPPEEDEDLPPELAALRHLPLDQLLKVEVITASKSAQTVSEAPAIVSVISGDELRAWGYRSVAEALSQVPGFYGIDDLLTPNFGIRGINGGQRAYNRIMKVMINGMPVSFRPDSTNFLGPELIPMLAVDHIEVVRGPASALYGADAYLGVVNIITRSGRPEQPGELAVRGGTSAGSGLGRSPHWFANELLFAPTGERVSLLLAGSLEAADRSGYALPAGSPALTTGAWSGDTTSKNDLARPASLYGQAALRLGDSLQLTAQASYSHLSSHGEFLDFGTLSHQNLVVIDNFVGQAKAAWAAAQHLSFTAAAGLSAGGPTSGERLFAGDPSSYPRRDLGYLAIDLSAEGRYQLREHDSLTLGADLSSDDEQLLTAWTVAADGSQTPSSGVVQGKKTFTNAGLFAQLVAHPLPARRSLGLTGNLRFDHHSDYGSNLNWRGGLVDQLTEALSVKLLAGSSFKAPSAVQRYAQPLYVGDVIGNQTLQPETAATVEAQASLKASESLLLSINVYRTHVSQKVELLPSGGNATPRNAGSVDSVGLESEARFVAGRHDLSAGLQWQRTDDNTDDPFRGSLSAPSSSYPEALATAAWHYRHPVYGGLHLRARYASQRRSSKSNSRIDNLRPYALDAYALADLGWTFDWSKARFGLQIDNLFNASYSEPGYSGIDFPGRRRELSATASVRF